MRRVRLGGVAVAAAVWSLGFPGLSHAARVLVLQRDGRTVVRNDPFLAAETPSPAPPAAMAARRAHPRATTATATVWSVVTRLRRSRVISSAEYYSYLASYSAALSASRQLQGTRAAELGAVIANLQSIAAGGLLTPSRLPVLFLTLDRNRQWWTTGSLPSRYQRVEFAGSRLVWEYYPGQGIELQELGSFSTAQALCSSGRRNVPSCTELLSELIPLGAMRAGRLTWEYYFNFDGGTPPWTSAMSQGTALQAFADAYRATGDASYLTVGDRALALFTGAPPWGVAVRTARGARYVQYTFDPARGDEVINAFLQSLIGLDDYAKTSKNPLAELLFAAGNAEAQAELPSFDTGAWSLYQPGIEDDLNYHQLVTTFLQQLCAMTKAPLYCTTASHFEQDLKTPPRLQLLTTRLKARRASTIYFELSKVSHVGITIRRGATTVFLTSADFTYGRGAFDVPPLAGGTYTVRLDATDLAGNYNQFDGRLRVVR